MSEFPADPSDPMPSEQPMPHWRAREVLVEEAGEILAASERIGPAFDDAVDLIMRSPGRVALTGMGKHGLVARKIAATLASTGTVSYFLDPAEGRHGDLGMVHPTDVVIAVSNSGSTEEVLGCVPFFKRNGNAIIAMTGVVSSPLALAADVILDVSVKREVCSLNLAPTTSTTLALAMGDALAVVLMERRNFRPEDFALRHPGGKLGRRLLLKVTDLLHGKPNPVVPVDASFGEAVEVMTRNARGAVSIVGPEGELVGILTDGDLRRTLQAAASDPAKSVADLMGRPVRALMQTAPMFITEDTLAADALTLMEAGPRKVLVLPVVNNAHVPVGMIQIHDLIEAGL
jgi:arabinose-5-phosphate isomerase